MAGMFLSLELNTWEEGSAGSRYSARSLVLPPRGRAATLNSLSTNGPMTLPPSPLPMYTRDGAPPPPATGAIAEPIVGSVDVILQLIAANDDIGMDEAPITGEAYGEDAEGAFSSDRLHMLVVDDVQLFRSLCGRFLRRLGCTFVVLEDGDVVEAAVADAVAAGKPYDGILMDIHMPRMSGAEVCAALRAKAFHLPIIAMTSSTSDEEKATWYDTGFDVVLPKPFTQDCVRSALEEALSRTTARRAKARRALTARPALPLALDILSL